MATILELTQMSENLNNVGSPTPTDESLLAGLSGNWTVFETSDQVNSQYWGAGYFGVVYRNTVTGEIVIANRGTALHAGLGQLLSNLGSDVGVGAGQETTVEDDAQAFALAAIADLKSQDLSIPNVIETGHSLGGAEAQAAIVSLSSNHDLNGVPVSGVVFDAPGISSSLLNGAAPSSYNVLNIVTQGDAVHAFGAVHLGDQLMLATGPSTSGLAIGGLAGIATGIGIFAVAIAELYEILDPAHSIGTILSDLSPTGADSNIGSTDWTTSSDTALANSGSSGTLPTYSVNAQGAFVITDPVSNTALTSTLSPDGQQVLMTFTNNGSSAVGAALAALGQVSIPVAELNQGLGALNTASPIYETLSRTATGAFDVTFQATGGAADPAGGPQMTLTATVPGGAFFYAVPTGTQNLVETIDNGPGDSSGSISVLAGTVTQLTGGTAVLGQPDTWIDTNNDQYTFVAATPDSSIGTLTISQGLLGSAGNEIVIDNFNLTLAEDSTQGDLGIVFSPEWNLTAGATVGTDPPANFPAGSQQSYTLSVDAPSTTAQTITVTLAGANPSDFEAMVGNNVVQLNGNGTFTVTLAAGQTNVSFGLIDITPDDGTSDIASGATLQLTASLPDAADPGGPPIQVTPLQIAYGADSPVTAKAPQPGTTLLGQYNSVTDITTYTGDGGNDDVTATGTSNAINLANSASDSITGGSGTNTIHGGSGDDVITLDGTSDWVSLGNGFNTLSGSAAGKDTIYGHGGEAIISGNGGTDLVFGRNGNSAIYAGAQVSVAQAIAQAGSATATGKQGDLIGVGDGDNTIVGGDGNDLITAGSGNDVVVLGPGNDSFDNLSGVLGHGDGFPNLKELSVYGDPGQEVKLLDGVLLAVHSEILIETGLRFDPRFAFDFYDLDFCRQAEKRGLKMGTWAISAIHASAGKLGSNAWRAGYRTYLEKYDEA